MPCLRKNCEQTFCVVVSYLQKDLFLLFFKAHSTLGLSVPTRLHHLLKVVVRVKNRLKHIKSRKGNSYHTRPGVVRS